jgi:hypothetical protein
MDPRVNNILSERDERRHAELKAKMIAGVSYTALPSYRRLLRDCTRTQC